MKKDLFLATALAGMLFLSCNPDAGGLSAAAKKNLDAMHGIQQCFDTKDFSKLGDYVTEDAVDHAGDGGDLKGLANMKAEFEKMSANNENAKTEIIKELADDDYVMSWLRFTGTLKNAQMGMKAGERYDMKAIELAKFKDGKVTEHWTFLEPAEMMKMMPAPVPPPAEPARTDTVKKM